MFFLIIGVTLLSLVVLVYFLYYILIFGSNHKITKYLEAVRQALENKALSLPKVTMIIPTYEEAKVILRKLRNTKDLDYPMEKMEIIVVDDASKDGTAEIAENAFTRFGLNGRVLMNSQRIGLNASLNIGIEAASNDFICISDSDVTFEKSALKNAVSVLMRKKEVGGVTGRIVPSFGSENMVTRLEENYRKSSNRSMLAESYRHSAFPGSGVLIVFKRSALSDLIPSNYGSTDGNLSVSIIRGGHRFWYVPYADVYEPVPEDVRQHRLQKVRRARRLIQVLLHNTDVLFQKKYGEFGFIIFPLKFAMLVFCPILMFLGFASTIFFILLSQNIILHLLLLLALSIVASALSVSQRVRSLVLGFVLHQLYLIAGLFSSASKGTFWKKIERR